MLMVHMLREFVHNSGNFKGENVKIILVRPKMTPKQPHVIGVRAWLARGYSIPGGVSQRGGGQTPAFRVARSQTRPRSQIKSSGSRQPAHRQKFRTSRIEAP